MLETMNRYIHGYVAVPVTLACYDKEFFTLQQEKKPLSIKELAHLLGANEGHLAVALCMFEALNWVKKDDKGLYELTLDIDNYNFIHSIPKDIISLYKIPISSLLNETHYRRTLSHWLSKIINNSYSTSPLMIDFLQGAVIVPLLLALKKEHFLEPHTLQQPLSFKGIPTELRHLILTLFINKKWAEQQGENNIVLTALGQSFMERAFNMATAASYAPMLASISELLFGDPKKVFRRDKAGHELHVDRTLNVLSSGFQHERYFADVEDIIISIFNQEPFENQPRYVIDMGCGDGSFLKKIYELICTKTARGKALQQYPIAMIGVDYNQKSLDATEATLQRIPHYTLQGDISDPERLMKDLKSLGIPDPENCLHVRSFLDHDRPFLLPTRIDKANARSRVPYQGAYVTNEGKAIAPNIAVQSLVEHFGRWSSIMSKHGLVILEVHSLAPKIIASYLDENESFHFDAYHAFSMQHLVEADVFLLAAAETGLFPKKEFAKKYPLVFPYTRITLNYLEKRPYTFSNAQPTDLADLVQLEAQCWPEHLRVPEQELNSRLERFPEGQFVIKQEEKIVGVIYTQRITDMHLLSKVRLDQVGILHDSLGDTLQLLGFNIVPEMQDRGFGDQILEFVLQLAFSKSGIKKIVGVTRCKNYKGNFHMPINEYVQQHIDSPDGVDPILRFHTSHGAKIVNILQNYRPEDMDNQGAGILIEYNPSLQRQDLLNQTKFIEKQSNQDEKKISDNEIFSCILEVLPQRNAVQFSPTQPLREMGFDSLGLLELRTLMNKRFGTKLDSTFFFEYATPSAIADHLQEVISLSSPLDVQIESSVMNAKSGEKAPLALAERTAVAQSQYANEHVEKRISQEAIYSCIRELLPKRYATHFSPTQPLREMGFDSLGLLELRTLMNKRFGTKLDSTFFFQYATPGAIADHLQEAISLSSPLDVQIESSVMNAKSGEKAPLALAERTAVAQSQYALEPIAIVGMSCRFPGGINNISDYWEVLKNGQDVISKVPSNRVEMRSSSNLPSEGGYLTDVDKFDSMFFNISPREAELMDPQQRILLETTWGALEQAAIKAESLRGTKTGVFVGIFSHDYETLLNKNQTAETLDAYYGTGNSASVAAGRLSYVLGLHGPSIAVNTACSSSLVAVHLACQSLRQGESQLAIAGGVNLILSPELSLAFSKSGMLSLDGRCKTFDASADGYGRSEGCGVIILKRLSQALSDGDNILGVLRSSAVNQDGASNGLTAPNKAAQKDLIQSTLSAALLDSQTITYVEAHGTGTALGDPIEVKALVETYGKERTKENPLFLGSVKTNIGHTEAAAGIAGLIKVVLALKHQLIPSHLHFTRLNPHIDFGKCDVQIPTKSLPWPTFDESPRRGAVSSFGFSGTNAHVVIEEGPGCVLSAQQAKPYYLLALSAKHPDSLKQRLEDLHGHLKDHADLPLEAIAYTLNVGRNHFDYRCAFVVSSIEELQDALEEIKQGKKPNHYLIAKDKISTEQEPIFEEILGRVLEELPEKKSEPSTYYKKLLSLADLYIKGYNIDWEVLHQREAKQRISLPTYPFLKKSYWINQKEIKGGIETISRTTSLHPLLDANVSTLEAQCFTKVFTEQEFYLADHQVNNDILLPGAVYLEMARAAGELALPHQSILGFSNIGWLRPLKVDHKPQMAKIKIYSLDSEVRFEVITEPREDSGDSSKSVIHAQGTIRYAAKGQTSPELIRLDVEGIKAGCSKKQSKDNIYAVLKSKGLVYGAGFQTIEELWYNDTETLAKLCLPPHLDHNQQWGLHPSLMEGALQASMNFIGEKSTSPYLLFSVEDLDIYMKVPGTHTSYYAYLQKEEHNRFHVALLDEKGLVCFKLRNVMVQPLEATPSVQVSETATLIYTIKKIITESLKIDISILEESNNIGDIGIDSIVFMEILKNIKKELNLDNIFLSEFAGINTISSLINFVVNKYNKTQTQTYSETNPVMIKNEGIKDDTISKYRKVFLNYDQIKTSVLKTSNNMNIEVIKAGSGYPLVLLPPLDSISTAWRYQILEFSKSYEVISLHYPGYGRSSYRRDLANLDQISDDIMEILDKLGINSSINLVGWSLGGLISQILAAKYPDMLNTLSLVNTTFKLEEDNELENIYNLMKMLREDFESNSYRLKDKSNKDTITINHLRDLRPHEVSMQYFKNVFEFDSREKLSLIKTPTLIISGVDDKATPPKYAEYINTCIKNSQHHSLKGGGHYIPLFNSQYFNEMLSKFLTTHTIRLERNAGDHARQAKDIPALGF